VRKPRSVRQAEVGGVRVLVRADLNVPLEDGRITDDTRIHASLPTLRYLLEQDAKEVAVCSHLGRPQGPDPAFSMTPVARRLRELLPDERIDVLENTRFDPGETKNDPELARRLADDYELFVEDAFGSVHRAHASTVGVAELLPAYAGLLLERELEELGRLLGEVERPFVLVSGGAKVDDKLGVLRNLGGKADTVLIGGKMAEQLRDENPLGFPVELPSDVVAAAAFERTRDERSSRTTSCRRAGSGSTSARDARALRCRDRRSAHDLLERADGRLRVAALRRGNEGRRAGRGRSDAFSVVGGADSIQRAQRAGSHRPRLVGSTGGGAALELLEGKELPGVAVIPSA
jgi:3-phosphoglycerate kinase